MLKMFVENPFLFVKQSSTWLCQYRFSEYCQTLTIIIFLEKGPNSTYTTWHASILLIHGIYMLTLNHVHTERNYFHQCMTSKAGYTMAITGRSRKCQCRCAVFNIHMMLLCLFNGKQRLSIDFPLCLCAHSTQRTRQGGGFYSFCKVY